MNQQIPTELDILSDVISPERSPLAPDVAKSILKWKFPAKSVARMNRLAERNSIGKITPEERVELDRYLRVGSVINLFQAKARWSLANAEVD